jgi:butyrate kinase
MSDQLILVINPGSTSTKIAVTDVKNERHFQKTIKHPIEDLEKFEKIADQYEFRKQVILDTLKTAHVDLQDFVAVIGRGGLCKPIPSGLYEVNEKMKEDVRNSPLGEHASNLGCLIADDIAKDLPGVTAFIADPVVVDELEPLARIAGHPNFERISIFHALNQKAVARKYAKSVNKSYRELNLIVVHLGGGITIGAHKEGRVIDVNQGLDGEGPFSPERSGTLPTGQMASLCFSGKYTHEKVKKMIKGKGGCSAYLGTNDALEIENRIKAGDEHAKLIYEAMAYQVSKEIGAYATVLQGKVDAILLSGGIAYDMNFVEWIKERVDFIAPMFIYPGQDEMQALADNVIAHLKGTIRALEYNPQ